jgi:hypothetical protein
MYSARRFCGSYINVQPQEGIIMQLYTTLPSETSFMNLPFIKISTSWDLLPL